MKLQLLTFSLLAGASHAFVPIAAPTTVSSLTTSTSLAASRRKMMEQAAGSLLAGAVILTGSPAASNAEARPMYLTEPTDEFKANEEKAMVFKRAQLAQKKKFLDSLEKLATEKDDEEALAEDLRVLRRLIIETEGLPVGIKKDDFYKQIRTKKAKGYWPTKVEIEYQGLKNEIIFQQSPDSVNKSEGSPY